mgnify:FL=1
MTADERDGDVLHRPPEDAPGAGAMYPRVERLEHAEGDGDVLLATFEHYASADEDDGPYFQIYRSTDGGETWSEFSELHDTQNGWGLRYQPVLFELPEAVGPWSAGTVIAAGNSLPEDRSQTSIDVYASEDGGRTWSYLSTLAEGGRAVPGAGETPVWEPEFALDADGNLVCYFADERHREDGYDQLVGHRVSRDGGQTWEEEVFDVAIPDGEERPGMPVVTRLPDGRYVMVYEIVGPTHEGGVYLKVSPDGTDWGDPTAVGHPVRTADGRQLTNGPYVTWTPAGGEDGTLLVSAKILRDSTGEQAPGSGRTLLATTDFEEFETWEPVSAPLRFEDVTETGEQVVAWTTPLLPSRDGTRLLEMTSTYVDDEWCEIRYAVADIDFDSR